MSKLQTYTILGPCTPAGMTPPCCPVGWESVGIKTESCEIGNVPGDGPKDLWRMGGYQRVCKKTVPSSGDIAADCCSNLFGISNSVECKTSGWSPYSWKCNNAMQNRCNTNVQKDPYSHNWNGMPYGTGGPVYSSCSGKTIRNGPPKKAGKMDEFCVNYLRNAPPNNFFYNHDYSDYPYNFPHHSYSMPDFNGGWGYQPMRTPYKPYHEYEWKDRNNYCRMNPKECGYGNLNNYHY